MSAFGTIHAKITQHGAAFTDGELKVLQREIKEFIATYCQFVDEFGPDSDSKERGELCAGINICCTSWILSAWMAECGRHSLMKSESSTWCSRVPRHCVRTGTCAEQSDFSAR